MCKASHRWNPHGAETLKETLERREGTRCSPLPDPQAFPLPSHNKAGQRVRDVLCRATCFLSQHSTTGVQHCIQIQSRWVLTAGRAVKGRDTQIRLAWPIWAFLSSLDKNNLTYKKVEPQWKYYKNTECIKWRIEVFQKLNGIFAWIKSLNALWFNLPLLRSCIIEAVLLSQSEF